MEKIQTGWSFKNESECFNFLANGGSVASYQLCTFEKAKIGDCENDDECCPPIWDGFLCWPSAPPNSVVEQLCPGNLKQLNHKNFAFRNCSSSGWLSEDGSLDDLSSNVLKPIGFTNFKPCFDPAVFEIVKNWVNVSDDVLEKKEFIVNTTRLLEICGYSLSFFSIALSIFILCHFRVLRTQEKRIHFHLYVAMIIQVLVRLSIYLDQHLSKSDIEEFSEDLQTSTSLSTSVCGGFNRNSTLLSPSNGEIIHLAILCKLSWVLLEYTRTAMFHWMFLEGFHLHNILVVNVFLNNTTNNHQVYLVFGWIGPMLSTLTWAVFTSLHMQNRCWFGYNHSPFYWISEGPRLFIILGNFLFLLNIIRMLYTKVGNPAQNSDSRFSQLRVSQESRFNWPFDPVERGLRTSVKAAIVLQPLLGITNILQIVVNPYDSEVPYFAFWSVTTAFLASFQGFFAALFYCFCNKEVQKAIHHWFAVHNSRRQTQSALPIQTRSESIKTTRIKLSFKRSSIPMSRKRPSWCQEMPSSSYQQTQFMSKSVNGDSGEGIPWSPRGRSIDTRANIISMGRVEEAPEVQTASV